MELVVAVAASAAAAAAKEEALATSVAAVASVKEAAAAAATAKEARDAAEDAATELIAKEATVKAAPTVTAAVQASKKCKFHLIVDDQDPPGTEDVVDGGCVDFISRLPDDVLGNIILLLTTKEGARTQAISRRWRPLWSSAPLNLVTILDPDLIPKIPKILSQHPGPAHRFSVWIFIRDYYNKVQGWLSSQAMDSLQELELNYIIWDQDRKKQLLDSLQELELNYIIWDQDRKKQLLYVLPSSAYRFAPTLRVAKLSGCHIPDLIVHLSLEFPRLKQLTLDSVIISEDALQNMLSGCLALESLELKKNSGFAGLCISSQTLKSIGFGIGWRIGSVRLQELVIEDAPCLERLLPLEPHFGPATIRVILAPKLEILGVLSENIAQLEFGTMVFQKMVAVSLTTKMHTVRLLVLDSDGPNLDSVANFLKCFSCLERLYVNFKSGMVMNNVKKYDPLDPIECLELHLKEVVLKNYDGLKRKSIDFTKFFVLNAEVLKEMKITLPYHRDYKWFANQRRLLQIENRASRDAQIELTCGIGTMEYFTHDTRAHDLLVADPFDNMPSRGCSKCSRGPC